MMKAELAVGAPIAKYSGMPGGGTGELTNVESMADRREKIQQRISTALEEANRLDHIVSMVERSINLLPSEDRMIIEMRFKENKSWMMIADKLSYAEKWTARKGHRAIKAITRMLFGDVAFPGICICNLIKGNRPGVKDLGKLPSLLLCRILGAEHSSHCGFGYQPRRSRLACFFLREPWGGFLVPRTGLANSHNGLAPKSGRLRHGHNFIQCVHDIPHFKRLIMDSIMLIPIKTIIRFCFVSILIVLSSLVDYNEEVKGLSTPPQPVRHVHFSNASI